MGQLYVCGCLEWILNIKLIGLNSLCEPLLSQIEGHLKSTSVRQLSLLPAKMGPRTLAQCH